ncbi:protein of unknown function [Rhodococcus koreensis]|uniref:Uncharacterized protein n=1 Tax=Rhodococcus koreensis TaxID=99653 RepID=A0A1H4IC98_9NOCA|nr:protein of unknown function [Rhodococcus koreensis]
MEAAVPTVRVVTFDQFEDSFPVVAACGVGRDDFRRFGEVVARNICDLPFAAAAIRQYIIDCTDLPLTKGLRASSGLFRGLGPRTRVEPILG